MDTHTMIIKPVITERSMDDVAKGKFTFLVSRETTKDMIRKAVERKFNVNVLSVATIMVKGKTRRSGTRRTEVTIVRLKKAIVKLKKDQKIDLFEVGSGQ